jgi:hypothetical protein
VKYGRQKIRWDKSDTKATDNYTFFYGNGNIDHHLGTGFFEHKGIISAVTRVEFVKRQEAIHEHNTMRLLVYH